MSHPTPLHPDHDLHHHPRRPSLLPVNRRSYPSERPHSFSPRQRDRVLQVHPIAPSFSSEVSQRPAALSFTTASPTPPHLASACVVKTTPAIPRPCVTVSLLLSPVPPSPQRRAAARLSSAVARLAGYLAVRHTHATNPSTAQHFRLLDCALTCAPSSIPEHSSEFPHSPTTTSTPADPNR